MEKIVYAAPQIKKIGSFEDLTQTTFTGGFLDGTYPQNTPLDAPIRGPMVS